MNAAWQGGAHWLHRESLVRVWSRIGDALERRSLVARGRVEVGELSRAERHALSDVLGRPVTTDVVRIELTTLDERLASLTGHDLPSLVGHLLGRPLVDRSARRRDAARQRDEPFEAAADWLGRHGLDREVAAPGATEASPWIDRWLSGLRRDGVLTGVPESSLLLVTALEVLHDRGAFEGWSPDDHETEEAHRGRGHDGGAREAVVARTDLAARQTGSAHGLDDGTKLTLLVLRAAAAKAGEGLPRTATDRRRLWESLGVIVDRVSVTCVTWNVRRSDSEDQARQAADRPGSPAPTHVTWWDLEAGCQWAPGQTVLVCENPRTLEAIASSGTSLSVGVVCTMGRSNLVVREVLARLVLSGARLRYHGDFDWPGVSLANACLEDFGAQPWLMSTEEYLSGHGADSLSGRPTEPAWDPELGAAMRSRGVAVHEEAVLPQLLERLTELHA